MEHNNPFNTHYDNLHTGHGHKSFDQKKRKDDQITDMEHKHEVLMKRNNELEDNIYQLKALIQQMNPIQSKPNTNRIINERIKMNKGTNSDIKNQHLIQIVNSPPIKLNHFTKQIEIKPFKQAHLNVNKQGPESGLQAYNLTKPIKKSRNTFSSNLTHTQRQEYNSALQSLAIQKTCTTIHRSTMLQNKDNNQRDELNQTIRQLTQKVNQLNEELVLDKLEGKYSNIIQYELDKWKQRNTILNHYSSDSILKLKDKRYYYQNKYNGDVNDISNQCDKELELLKQLCIRRVKTQKAQIDQLKKNNNSIKQRLQKATDIIGKKK